MPARILQIAFCLALGNVSTPFAQIHYDLTNKVQLASVTGEPQVPPASRNLSTDNFTNQHLSLHSVPAPRGDTNAGLNYSMSLSQQGIESELNQAILPSRIRLEDLVQTTSPQGWRIGDGGILGYRSPDRRCRLVFRYSPDFHSILQDFDRLDAFSLVWQLNLGRHKPAN